jgi:hypothetical protein
MLADGYDDDVIIMMPDEDYIVIRARKINRISDISHSSRNSPPGPGYRNKQK